MLNDGTKKKTSEKLSPRMGYIATGRVPTMHKAPVCTHTKI